MLDDYLISAEEEDILQITEKVYARKNGTSSITQVQTTTTQHRPAVQRSTASTHSPQPTPSSSSSSYYDSSPPLGTTAVSNTHTPAFAPPAPTPHTVNNAPTTARTATAAGSTHNPPPTTHGTPSLHYPSSSSSMYTTPTKPATHAAHAPTATPSHTTATPSYTTATPSYSTTTATTPNTSKPPAAATPSSHTPAYAPPPTATTATTAATPSYPQNTPVASPYTPTTPRGGGGGGGGGSGGVGGGGGSSGGGGGGALSSYTTPAAKAPAYATPTSAARSQASTPVASSGYSSTMSSNPGATRGHQSGNNNNSRYAPYPPARDALSDSLALVPVPQPANDQQHDHHMMSLTVPQQNNYGYQQAPQAQQSMMTTHSGGTSIMSSEDMYTYQRIASRCLEKEDYAMIAGTRYIKRTGWRKIALAVGVCFEIITREIVRDERGCVLRAEFVVRARIPSGRFCDGWGSCDKGEKRFNKPNHDIPATAETRAKSRATADLTGVGDTKHV